MAYNLQNPFISHIKYRVLLNDETSPKKTYHLILDIKDENITFSPGDSLAIIPQNDPEVVDLIINFLQFNENEEIVNPKDKLKIKLKDFLLHKANITKPTYNFLSQFTKISKEEAKIILSSNHIIDIIKKYPNNNINLQAFCDTLLPLLPRLYSCASSIKMYPDELHLVITHVSYELNGSIRNGVATDFLCKKAKINKTPIPVYIQKSHGFSLIKDERPIIMIAAGCGIAPFRAFMEERFLNNIAEASWLFFGERNQKRDFYFEKFFKDLEERNFLRITTAFSRDQEDKIYVQDRVKEMSEDVWQWINHGAVIYICGNTKMAKEVDETIQEIFIEEGNLNKNEAYELFKKLIKEKRYLKDVY